MDLHVSWSATRRTYRPPSHNSKMVLSTVHFGPPMPASLPAGRVSLSSIDHVHCGWSCPIAQFIQRNIRAVPVGPISPSSALSGVAGEEQGSASRAGECEQQGRWWNGVRESTNRGHRVQTRRRDVSLRQFCRGHRRPIGSTCRQTGRNRDPSCCGSVKHGDLALSLRDFRR